MIGPGVAVRLSAEVSEGFGIPQGWDGWLVPLDAVGVRPDLPSDFGSFAIELAGTLDPIDEGDASSWSPLIGQLVWSGGHDPKTGAWFPFMLTMVVQETTTRLFDMTVYAAAAHPPGTSGSGSRVEWRWNPNGESEIRLILRGDNTAELGRLTSAMRLLTLPRGPGRPRGANLAGRLDFIRRVNEIVRGVRPGVRMSQGLIADLYGMDRKWFRRRLSDFDLSWPPPWVEEV